MSKCILGNREHEQQLIKFVKQYGLGRWSEIARAMKIYGIYIPRAIDLRDIYRTIVPDGECLQANEINDLIKFGINCRGDPKKFTTLWVCKYGVNKPQLPRVFNKQIKTALLLIASIFCRKKQVVKKYLTKLQFASLKNFLKVGDIESDDPLTVSIHDSANIISNLIILYADQPTNCRTAHYEVYAKVTRRYQVEQAIQYIKYIDALTQISIKAYHQDEQIKDVSEYLKPTIQENRNSQLYQMLFKSNNWNSMFKSYNEAKDQLTSPYLYNPVQTQPKKVGIPNFTQVAQNKLKTVRGRINQPGKQFYSESSYSVKFRKDLVQYLDKESSSSVDVEANQLIQQLNKDPEEQEIDLEISNDPKLREYIEKRHREMKHQLYKEYKDLKKYNTE